MVSESSRQLFEAVADIIQDFAELIQYLATLCRFNAQSSGRGSVLLTVLIFEHLPKVTRSSRTPSPWRCQLGCQCLCRSFSRGALVVVAHTAKLAALFLYVHRPCVSRGSYSSTILPFTHYTQRQGSTEYYSVSSHLHLSQANKRRGDSLMHRVHEHDPREVSQQISPRNLDRLRRLRGSRSYWLPCARPYYGCRMHLPPSHATRPS